MYIASIFHMDVVARGFPLTVLHVLMVLEALRHLAIRREFAVLMTVFICNGATFWANRRL